MLIDITWSELQRDGTAQYELIDSEFGCIKGVCGATSWKTAGVIIIEYSKRNLNVAANLVKLLVLHKEKIGWSFEQQIKWWTLAQPLFTPELQTELDKYLLLV